MLEITSSSLKTYQTCPRKYYYLYVLLLKARIEKVAFLLGRNLHQQLDYYYTHQKMDTDFIANLPSTKESAILKGMLSGYAKKYSPKEFAEYVPEKVFAIQVPHLGITAKGRKDAIITDYDGVGLIKEIKTTSDDIEVFKEKMDNDLQPLFYLWAHYMETGEMLDGVLYRIIKKPQLRLKKTETEEQYYDRLTAEYTDLEKYFHTYKVYKTNADLLWFQDELDYYAKEMAREQTQWPRNLQRCFDYFSTCEFMPLCQKKAVDNGLIASCYARKTVQHEELIEEETKNDV